ncbi:MAG: glycerophosphodiester phosphodiesterase family protein [Anaerolineales bacterium]
MSLSWGSPLIFAHRGASAYAPENTIAAFDLAIQQNADVIELDTKLSADGHVVVIHDQSVDRTTDGSGRVSELSLANLRELDAGSHFSDTSHGEQIPTLEEILEIFAGRIFFYIELTNYRSPFDALPMKVAQLIDRYDLDTQILVSSFHPVPLRRFHHLLPSIPIGFLAKRGTAGLISRRWFGNALVPYQAIHPEKSDISPTLITKAHQSGKRVHTFTVNSADEMAKLLSLNVDGIITDDPLLAHQVVGRRQLI